MFFKGNIKACSHLQSEGRKSSLMINMFCFKMIFFHFTKQNLLLHNLGVVGVNGGVWKAFTTDVSSFIATDTEMTHD